MKTRLFSYPTPFTPPTTEEDELSVLRLFRSRRVGPTTFHKLIADHGTPEAALAALPALAAASGARDYAPCPEGVARAELAAGRRAGARLITCLDPDYPAELADLPDAPPVLWALGRRALLARPRIAIVGTRNASSLGLRMTRSLAAELGALGFVIVSGLARGIDAEAHRASLATGTIGVQAGGIDVVYPAENADLHAAMAERGLRLSELPPGFEPRAPHFPQRNRIIAGLSRATIVIEAAPRSGSLQTARLAGEQGREVMAVPGHPLDPRASGCNMLLRDGATLVRGAEDVCEALGIDWAPAPAAAPAAPAERPAPAAPPPGTSLRILILAALGPSPTPEDALIRALAAPTDRFLAEITALELEGQVQRHPGGQLSRVF